MGTIEDKKARSVWVHGLAAAVITGASNSFLLMAANAAFSIANDPKHILIAVATSTLVSTCSYLKQSPLPKWDFEGGDTVSPVAVFQAPK